MTGGAGHIGMPVRKQESRGAVIELGVQPAIKRVAIGAGRRCEKRSGLGMRGIRGALKVRHVAGFAGRRQPQVVPSRGVLVAFLAGHDRMGAEQRKPVEVLLNRLDRDLPAENRVALRTVGAELTPVDVGVTIGAVLSNVGENRFGVASRAGHFFMHSAQRVTCAVMIEFGNGTDRRPTGAGVAIFAGNRERSVRASAGLPLGGCGHG